MLQLTADDFVNGDITTMRLKDTAIRHVIDSTTDDNTPTLGKVYWKLDDDEGARVMGYLQQEIHFSLRLFAMVLDPETEDFLVVADIPVSAIRKKGKQTGNTAFIKDMGIGDSSSAKFSSFHFDSLRRDFVLSTVKVTRQGWTPGFPLAVLKFPFQGKLQHPDNLVFPEAPINFHPGIKKEDWTPRQYFLQWERYIESNSLRLTTDFNKMRAQRPQDPPPPFSTDQASYEQCC